MVRLIAYVHGNRERGFSLCIKLGLHKRVFILTLMNEIPKIPLNHTAGGSFAPAFTPFSPYVFRSNMSHILEQNFMLIALYGSMIIVLRIVSHINFF